MILIVGSEGNMGERYKACLSYFGEKFVCMDIGHTHPGPGEYDHILIATPTSTHLEMIKHYAPEGKPILCEKPIVKTQKDLDELEKILFEYPHIYMVNQYAYNVLDMTENVTSEYDYFRHGTDGLLWDCIQIIALSNGDTILGETSPIWKCSINGIMYHQDRMDEYYLAMIADFIGEKSYLWGPAEILAAHEKVLKYEKDYRRDSSKKHVH